MSMRALRDFWYARSSRERAALAAGAALILAMITYAFVVRPMRAELARLDDELPRLRAQAMQTRLAAEEITRLRAKPPAGAIERAQLKPLMARLAGTYNLPAPVIVDEPNSTPVKAMFERVNVDQWLQWIDELHRGHRIVLVRARVDALDAPGIARAEAEFVLASGAR
jgi:type II secretory pathway component PulM